MFSLVLFADSGSTCLLSFSPNLDVFVPKCIWCMWLARSILFKNIFLWSSTTVRILFFTLSYPTWLWLHLTAKDFMIELHRPHCIYRYRTHDDFDILRLFFSTFLTLRNLSYNFFLRSIIFHFDTFFLNDFQIKSSLKHKA